MTNYNERLDEIIQAIAMDEQGVADDFAVGAIDEDTYQVSDDAARDKAKQAITSLVKELVAEAKPAKAVISDDEMVIDRARKSAANSALDVYEQNLLKALEEK